MWTNGKAEVGRISEEKKRREKIREEKEREERRGRRAEKAGKSRFTVFFPMVCGSGGSKSRLAKAAGAESEPSDEKLHAVCGGKHMSKSKCTKHTSASDHFWKLRC